MGKHISLIFSFILFVAIAGAQDKMLTMEDVVLKGRTDLGPKNIDGLQWIGNTNAWSFTDSTGMSVMRGAMYEKDTLLFTLDGLNSSLAGLSLDSLDAMPHFSWVNDTTISFEAQKRIIRFNVKSEKAEVALEKKMDQEAANFDMHDSTMALAYTRKNNLFIQVSGKQVQVTHDGDPGMVNGKLVHRQEFGIHTGTFWSNAGKLLAFYRKDETMVTDYPIPDYNDTPAGADLIRYPMAGGKSHEVTIGVYNLETGATIFLDTGTPADQYLTNVAWSPDDRYLYVAVLNRGQDHLRFNRYNATTGAFEKTLFEEKHDKYIQPLHAMEFVPGKPNRFIWQSRRDGWNHLYLYDISGKLIRQLTRGDWEVTTFKGFSPSGRSAFLTGTARGAVNRDFFRVALLNGQRYRLTRETGTHGALLNKRCTYFINRYSSKDTPRTISVRSVNGDEKKLLLEAPDPLSGYKLGRTSLFTIPNGQGDDLRCRLFTPPGLDTTRKYPVVVYVYNGPNVQLIRNTWLGGANLWFHYMAQKGFILFTVDGRGSANRGLKFEQALFRKLGTVEIEDQLAGVAYLKSLPYVDTERIGVHGWSYGGFMTTGLVTRHPGVFKAAVAGGTVTDWRFYEVMYTERYMDTPGDNPDGYKTSNLMGYIDSLDCKLLMIHGTSDDVVVYQHSMAYLKKAVEANKQISYFAYPGYKHNVRGKDRVHLLDMISSFFLDNL